MEPVQFHAIDGEGVTDDEGNHYYVLLGIGQEQIANPAGLSWNEVLSFLWEHYSDGKHAYSGFYLGYDFTEWLASLPEDRAQSLFSPIGKAKRLRKVKSRLGETHFPVYAGKWEFDLLGNKRFKFRPRGWDGDYMYVCDGGPFFQSSFLATINPDKWDEPICTPEEFARIKEGKENRSSAILDEDMRFYNRLENSVHERLMSRLQEGLLSIGIPLKPSQWFGPGQVAQTWMGQRKNIPTAKKLAECVPDWFLDVARKTYFGGWFEIFAHGIIEGESHEYDINSAYPYIIAQLPCLLHGAYSYGHGDPRARIRHNTNSGRVPLCIVQATVHGDALSGSTSVSGDVFASKPIGTMLHRTRKGHILRPGTTKGYFWLHELKAAQKAGFIDAVEWHEWFMYVPCECAPPLAEVAELYAHRLRVGKNTALGKAIKLLINSIYGKFAQSIGSPKYGNPVYASLITAGCRTMITEAIGTHPGGMSNVVMVATDGVYFLDPHPNLPLSDKLGDWEHGVHANLCLFKPGMYWDDRDRARIIAGQSPAFKARGINAEDFANKIASTDAAFRRWPKRVTGDLSGRDSFRWPEVKFMGKFSLTSCTQAMQRGKWHTAGTVKQNVELMQSSSHHRKRVTLEYDRGRKIYRSKPWMPGAWFPEESVAYEKKFGIEDPWSIVSLEEFGITPDGTVTDTFTEVIMRHDD